MLTRITALLALALAAGLIAAGCGDDDDDETTAATTTTEAGATGATGAATGEPLTKAEFIKQADAACAAGDKRIDAAFRGLGSNEPSDQELEQVVTDTVVPEIQGEIDAIRALTPPEGDEDEIAAILDAAQEALDEIEQDPSSLANGNPFKEANQLAQDYGLKVCGQD